MQNVVKLEAPAKINLFLEITGKRPDGYHDIVTLFAKIALADKITMKKSAATGLTVVNKTRCELSSGPDNLALRAAKAVGDEFGVKDGVAIKLEKHVPIGAGLGGGSSDAAAVIKGMCALFDLSAEPWKDKRILSIARKLGADVPVFLREESFLVGKGIGEKLTPLQVNGQLPYITIVYPGKPVSTADAYRGLELASRTEILTKLRALSRLMSMLGGGLPLDNWGNLLFNRLEQSVLPRYDFVRSLRARLAECGADAVLMSGSGACVFALSNSAARSKTIADKVSGGDTDVYTTRFPGGGGYADK